MQGWLNFFAVVIALFVIPFGVAKLLAKAWRMPNFYWRFAWTLFAFMFGLTVVYQSYTSSKPGMNHWANVKLGIDLRGGTILVYQVKGVGIEGVTQEATADAGQAVNMDELTVALRRRVDPDSVKDVTIRALGKDQVEIIIPEVDEDEVAMLKRKIASVGTLEFRITANERDHADIIQLAKNTRERVVKSADGKETLGWWVPTSPESDTEWKSPTFVYREVKEEGKDITEVLCVNDEYDVQGGYLDAARASFDGFNPIVEFQFNTRGAQLFRELTAANQPTRNKLNPQNDFYRQLGIILDGYLQSAPRLQSVISDRGQISGGFTPEKTEELAGVLKAGRLPAVLSKVPSSEMTTGPTLGTDTIYRAQGAILCSVLLIMLIMVYYYRFSGIIAVVSLMFLILLTFAIMVGIHAAFTLPGLAGLVLTVGMAVDANILIYERIREEAEAGSTVATSVRTGFNKALSAIVDSNITTVLVAVILYWIGTEQIRGFAIILVIGIAISMFSAIYVGRTIFEVALNRGWLKKIHMLRVFQKTHIPFLEYARVTLGVSALLIVISIIAVFARVDGIAKATSLFDIDFSGGCSVQVLFNEKQTEKSVYDKLSSAFQDLTVTDVTLTTDATTPADPTKELSEDNNMLHRRYNVTTTSPKGVEASEQLVKIQDTLKKEFGKELKTNSMTFTIASNEAPAAETPAPLDTNIELPPMEKPAEAAPEAPAQEAAPAETPAEAAPAPETPAAEAPAEAAPAEAPAEEAAPAQEAPAQEAAPEEAAPEAPAAEAPAAEAPAEAAPAQEAAPAEAPAEAPAAEAPAEAAPAPAAEAPAPEAQSLLNPMGRLFVLNLLAQTEGAEAPAAAPAEAAKDAAPAPVAENLPETKRQTSVSVKFAEAITKESLASLVDEALKNAQKQDVAFDVIAMTADEKGQLSQVKEDNGRRFQNWTVAIDLPAADVEPIFKAIQETVNTTPVFPACTTIGSQVASSTCVQGLLALFASLIGIIVYIWIRFQKVSFGLASTAGLIHNVLIALGLVALSTWCAAAFSWLMVIDFKLSLTMLAAFLTLIGYSLNDTIVVFDRIRESRGKDPQLRMDVVNASLNQTLARTVMTSVTTFIVSIALYIWGGQSIHGFAFVMTAGIIIGTYSSVCVATPLLFWMVNRKKNNN